MPPHPLANFEYKSTIKANLSLLVFIQDITYLK